MATKNAKNWVVWGLGATQVHQQHNRLIDHTTSYSTLLETMRLFLRYYRLIPKM